jgi:hypothetical protein
MSVLFLVSSVQAAIQIQNREIHEQTKEYRIGITYPEIAGATNFNQAIHGILDTLVQPFRSEKRSPPYFEKSNLEGHYTAVTVESGPEAGILSVLLNWSLSSSGAAHPGGGMASVNYDPGLRRVLRLSDLFRPGVHYIARISTLAIAQLNRQEFADPFSVSRGAGPVESNFKVFTLTRDDLVLHFPTYQVAAGAAGPQTVVIPLTTLASLLRKR